MHFDDGTNPWVKSENFIQVFHYGFYNSAVAAGISTSVELISVTIFYIFYLF